MDKINEREFMLLQPDFPNTSETDSFYLDAANRLLVSISESRIMPDLPEGVCRKMALNLIGYLQDIVSDSGLWRSFITANRELYGFTVPFHEDTDDYVDFELNRSDVRFLVWYFTAMLCEEKRDIYPLDNQLMALADICYDFLESVYDEAPLPENYNIARGLEFNDPDDQKEIYHLGSWLFLHSYLITPAFSMSLREILMSVDQKDKDADILLNKKIEDAVLQQPTGPLALYTPEWVYLMLEGKLPPKPEEAHSEEKMHPYYEAFVNATGGEEIKFFGSYEEMNGFFIDSLGWEKDTEHLAMAKGAADYILLVNKEKGLLMARGIAKCIKAPQNPYYDEEYARGNAIYLLLVRGMCPGDLLHFIYKNGWLPDAVFPGTDDSELVERYHDFIARCMLQLYYRGD